MINKQKNSIDDTDSKRLRLDTNTPHRGRVEIHASPRTSLSFAARRQKGIVPIQSQLGLGLGTHFRSDSPSASASPSIPQGEGHSQGHGSQLRVETLGHDHLPLSESGPKSAPMNMGLDLPFEGNLEKQQSRRLSMSLLSQSHAPREGLGLDVGDTHWKSEQGVRRNFSEPLSKQYQRLKEQFEKTSDIPNLPETMVTDYDDEKVKDEHDDFELAVVNLESRTYTPQIATPPRRRTVHPETPSTSYGHLSAGPASQSQHSQGMPNERYSPSPLTPSHLPGAPMLRQNSTFDTMSVDNSPMASPSMLMYSPIAPVVGLSTPGRGNGNPIPMSENDTGSPHLKTPTRWPPSQSTISKSPCLIPFNITNEAHVYKTDE